MPMLYTIGLNQHGEQGAEENYCNYICTAVSLENCINPEIGDYCKRIFKIAQAHGYDMASHDNLFPIPAPGQNGIPIIPTPEIEVMMEIQLERFNAEIPNDSAVLLCWGVLPRWLSEYADNLVTALRQKRCRLFCCGRTMDGFPRHLSRLPNEALRHLIPYCPAVRFNQRIVKYCLFT